MSECTGLDLAFSTSSWADLRGTTAELPIQIGVELGEELYAGVTGGNSSITRTALADSSGWNHVDSAAGTTSDSGLFFNLSRQTTTNAIIEFTAVVNSGTKTLSRYYDGTTSQLLPGGNHTIVNGLNRIEIGVSTYAQPNIYLYPEAVEVSDIDFIDISVKEIVSVSDYLYYQDETGWQCLPPEQDRDAAGTRELADDWTLASLADGWSWDGTNISFVGGEGVAGREAKFVTPNVRENLSYSFSALILEATINSAGQYEPSYGESDAAPYVTEGMTLLETVKCTNAGAPRWRYRNSSTLGSLTITALSQKQVLPKSSSYTFKDQKIAPLIFTNNGPLSAEAFARLQAYPELPAAVQGGLEVDSFDLTGLYGFSAEGEYVVNSVAGYGEVNAAVTSWGVGVSGTGNTNSSNDGVFTVHQEATSANSYTPYCRTYLDNTKTYRVTTTIEVLSGTAYLSRVEAREDEYYDETLEVGLHVKTLLSKPNSYSQFTVVFKGQIETSFDATVTIETREVKASKITNHTALIQSNARYQTLGAQDALLAFDEIGMVSGVVEPGWVSADGVVGSTFDVDEELDDGTGGLVDHTFIERIRGNLTTFTNIYDYTVFNASQPDLFETTPIPDGYRVHKKAGSPSSDGNFASLTAGTVPANTPTIVAVDVEVLSGSIWFYGWYDSVTIHVVYHPPTGPSGAWGAGSKFTEYRLVSYPSDQNQARNLYPKAGDAAVGYKANFTNFRVLVPTGADDREELRITSYDSETQTSTLYTNNERGHLVDNLDLGVFGWDDRTALSGYPDECEERGEYRLIKRAFTAPEALGYYYNNKDNE